MLWACAHAPLLRSSSRSPLIAAVGVVPAQAELQLGIQDDALLTSQEPNAWPFARGLGAQGHPLQHRLGAGRADAARLAPTTRPTRPTTSSTPTRWPSRRPRSARRACSRSSTRRAGPTATRAALRARSTPTSTASSAASSPGATRAPTRRRARSCRCRPSRTSPSGTSPTAASTCCRRARDGQTAARTFARLVARLRRRRARRLAGRARRRRADREPRRAGRRLADRVPRRLPPGRRPAPAGARVQPVHERPRARPTSPRRRRPTAPSRCATSTSSSTG